MPSLESIPVKARALTAIGDATFQAVEHLVTGSQSTLFPVEVTEDYTDLAAAFQKNNWSDEESATLINAYAKERERGRQVDLSALTRWVLAHHNDADAVIECLMLEPPEEVELLRRLSRQGSQKRVFLATWRLRQQEVVLKQVIGPAESAARIVARELQAYPLNLSHPNIIETYALHNAKGEVFLVERLVPEVLNDTSPYKGVHETANLLYDVAKALKFLHDNGLVHGDVKPDNIGHRGDDYVLLDFGICRPKHLFTPTVTPTGSIRTRAPEFADSAEAVH